MQKATLLIKTNYQHMNLAFTNKNTLPIQPYTPYVIHNCMFDSEAKYIIAYQDLNWTNLHQLNEKVARQK